MYVLSPFSHVWLFATPWTVAPRQLHPWDSPGSFSFSLLSILLILCEVSVFHNQLILLSMDIGFLTHFCCSICGCYEHFCICLLMHIFKYFCWIMSKNEIDGSYYVYICLFSRSGWIIFWSCSTNFHSIFYVIIVCVSSSGKMPVPIFLVFLICKSPFFIIPFAWNKKMYLDINPLSIVCLSFGFWLDK